jgi:O-antigen biosynthesis protein WbqP
LKRLLDIIFGTLFLVITLPLTVIASIAIKLDTKGPILFTSMRVGIDNSEFKMFKLRTMFDGTEIAESEKIKEVHKKITFVGKILRKYSIDEYPQFFSVITGKMSIVGPRPALPSQNQLILGRIRLGINKIKPGITGYAQINGRDKITTEQKLIYDQIYLNKRNFFFDIVIMAKTLLIIFNGKGISH